MKPIVHFKPTYFDSKVHPITIALIGCGGNGSAMLTQLARIHSCLKDLDFPGLFVHAFDGDTIEESNMGRQAFYRNEIGQNKAITLIERVNRCFQLDWQATPEHYGSDFQDPFYNITISCVDSVQARKDIINHIDSYPDQFGRHDYTTPFYWMDLGNTKDSGQFVLNTIRRIDQPQRKRKVIPCDYLPSIFELHADLEQHESKKDQGPSCSLRAALKKQNLFINTTLVQFAGDMLFSLLTDEYINYNGMYVNISKTNRNIAEILIKAA